MIYDNGPDSGSLGEHQAHPHSDDALSSYTQNCNHPSSHASTIAHEFSKIQDPVAVEETELSMLYEVLGVDVNTVVSDKLDHYNANTQRWAECTPEEWLAGEQGRFECRHCGDPFG